MAAKDDKRAGKYLTFVLQNETYGIEILKVQEIIGLMDITRVPRTPNYMRGVINLRGKVIPVIDLRTKFSLATQEGTEKTCIIVVQVPRDNLTSTTMGILVDEVSEVTNIEAEQIENTPNFGTTLDTEFILGVGKTGQKVIMLLDVDKVLTKHEAALLDNLAVA
ncbi:MAG: chemotaxis protein CheW [Planctomycetota bacterium]|jgi:purine-binding chemotaxis protein CheW|nr:chemotaxis protein CheW [Planctomycetota bacterium]